jgi:hypothetical protein
MNYVSAREGIPVPTKPYERAGRAEWVACCGMRHRPGAFHIHIEPTEPEPVAAPKPKPAPKPPKPRTQALGSSTPRGSQRTKLCACGTYIYPQSIQCMPCSAKRRAAEKRGAA